MSNIGYPVVNIDSKGDFTITKHKDFGGLINKFTVCEQILYELGDPENYISPDVVVDFTSIKVEDIKRMKFLLLVLKASTNQYV